MKPDVLWAELKRRRVVRVVVAYAAVAIGVLEVAQLTFESLGIPPWGYRLLVFAVLAGFPIAVALSWAFDVTSDGVRAEPSTTDAPSGSMGRWVIGTATVVAIALGAWQFTGGSEAVVAEGIDDELIAVVPFRVSSADDGVTILREGVIDLLAPVFSGSPRIVDSGAMISAWRGYAEDEGGALSEGQAVELARRMGAGRVLVGSVVGTEASFLINARLLRVPGGEAIGDASVDGSSSGLREAVSQLAAQVLSMEAGVEQGQIDYLAEVPLAALDAYLRGRSAYRRSAYLEARAAFARALDEDSTFALAALGARGAVLMGSDADRTRLGARADRLLFAHLDRLPPRDREFVELWVPRVGRRSAVEVVAQSGSQMVTRFPEKAEAWYLYGDQLFHAAWRVGEDDWRERAREAFERAATLDPGLEVVQQHMVFFALVERDTVGVRDLVERFQRRTEGSESGILPRVALAYVFNDSTQRRWFQENIERLSYGEIQWALVADWPGIRIPNEDADQLLDRMERAAIAEADRRQALDLRHQYLRSSGRAAEADDALRVVEAAFGPQPRSWVEAYLYWDGLEEPAEAAVSDLAELVDGRQEPLDWEGPGQARDACALELWRLRRGDTSGTAGIVARLRAGADDPDPAHGRNALCALTLETISAHQREASDAATLVAALTDVLDSGPSSRLQWPSLELARVLEERDDLAAAARVAGYLPMDTPFPFAGSTVSFEAGRLHDAAGNYAEALEHYRWALNVQLDPDPRLRARIDSIAARSAELQMLVGNSR